MLTSRHYFDSLISDNMAANIPYKEPSPIKWGQGGLSCCGCGEIWEKPATMEDKPMRRNNEKAWDDEWCTKECFQYANSLTHLRLKIDQCEKEVRLLEVYTTTWKNKISDMKRSLDNVEKIIDDATTEFTEVEDRLTQQCEAQLKRQKVTNEAMDQFQNSIHQLWLTQSLTDSTIAMESTGTDESIIDGFFLSDI